MTVAGLAGSRSAGRPTGGETLAGIWPMPAPSFELPELATGRYCARIAAMPDDMAACLDLRTLAFQTCTPDRDRFDDICTHVLIRETVSATPVCCFRMLVLEPGMIGKSYSAQFYDLSALAAYAGRMGELGRFCTRPGCGDTDILRLAWAAMTAIVDGNDIAMLFGCSSFAGTEPGRYLDAFAMLKARHQAPERWQPKVKAPDVFRYVARLRRRPDAKQAMLGMPPLLRSYLAMGGWVSDHAVVDRQMNTLHVFTGLEVAAIPPARKRLLRALLG